MELSNGWRVHRGDDPAYARPDFDDSRWIPVQMDNLGQATPGWHWLRIRLRLGEGHPHLHLLLDGGEGTYEVYVNGRRVEDGPRIRNAFFVKRPTERVIALDVPGAEATIAVRAHVPVTYAAWQFPLFLTAALGTPEAVEYEREALEGERLNSALPSFAINLALMLAGLAAFALWRGERKQSEYGWLGLYLFVLGLSTILFIAEYSGMTAIGPEVLIVLPMVYAFSVAQIEFTFSFAGQRVGRGWRAYEAVLCGGGIVLPVTTWVGGIPIDRYELLEALLIFPAGVLLTAMLFVWWQRGNREAALLIVPSLLPAATTALYDVGSAAEMFGWTRGRSLVNPVQLGPVSLQGIDLGDLAFLLAIGVVMFFRFTRVSREQARAAAELDAAREMQGRLVPAALPEVAGYAIEAAYLPAAEVGGDFYQVLPQGDATLVVVGDVSGKGLKAAMTGTLVLGALRTLAAEGLGPAALLTRLNGQMVTAGESGFITCLCARLTAEGEVTVANAGHLAPYVNGEEMAVDAGLPLGIASDAEYAERVLRLREGDGMTLLSDGVVEARSGGELFGFERTQAISRERAQTIADAAVRFGQEDDVTVVRVTVGPAAGAGERDAAAGVWAG